VSLEKGFYVGRRLMSFVDVGFTCAYVATTLKRDNGDIGMTSDICEGPPASEQST